jgi:hypothetical protein
MNHIETFDSWINEAYYSKNSNLYKIASSETPIESTAIFHDKDTQNFYAIRRSLDDKLANYRTHIKDMNAKDADWRKAAAGKRDEKSTLQWYDAASKTRNLALNIVEDSAQFIQNFNAKYNSVKKSLLGTDHVEIAKSILDLKEIYPNELINEAGKLKRMKKMKADAQFISDVLKWTESIKQIYNTFEEAGKLLGKTDKQIAGARKQSAAQRMRWGI